MMAIDPDEESSVQPPLPMNTTPGPRLPAALVFVVPPAIEDVGSQVAGGSQMPAPPIGCQVNIRKIREMVGATGLEPVTPSVSS